jgi:hypothetical protein
MLDLLLRAGVRAYYIYVLQGIASWLDRIWSSKGMFGYASTGERRMTFEV